MLRSCILAFLLTLVADVAWARYNIAVAARQAQRAAVYSIGIYLMGSVVTLTIVSHPAAILAACAGAYIGTYCAVVKSRREG